MLKIITSPQNEAIRLARSLRQRKYRERYGLFLIEGRHLLEEAIDAGVGLEYLFYDSDFGRSERGQELLAELRRRRCRCLQVTKSLMANLSATVTPPGVLAIARQQPCSLIDLLTGPGDPFLLVADGVQDPGNLGTMLRTALAAGARGAVLTPGTVDLYNEKVARATQGAIFRLPVATAVEPGTLVAAVSRAGWRLVVADVRGDRVYYDADLTGPLVLVIGSENQGPDAILLQAAAVRVRIPLWGAAESLNAAVAAGILLYEAARQRRRCLPGV
ncbi:MAG: methyltransferase, TrmH family [Clostridia bacterium]|nr:methyltransferase, TrmH family [Clostridia bacterium]